MPFTFSSDAAVDGEMGLFCDACDAQVCTIDEGDDLDIVSQCALDHVDECVAAETSEPSRKRSS